MGEMRGTITSRKLGPSQGKEHLSNTGDVIVPVYSTWSLAFSAGNISEEGIEKVE